MKLLAQRFPTLLGLVVLVGGIVGGWWYLNNKTPKVGVELKPSKVRITNVADNKFTVSWITSIETVGMVEFGPVGEKLGSQTLDDRDKSVGESKEYLTHQITIQDLQPSTQYSFRILSGKQKAKFDNNGSPYLVTTGPTIRETPVATSFYGEVSGTGSVEGTLVYVTLPGSTTASTLVKSAGNYAVTLSTIRTSDLSKYIEYDEEATVATVNVDSGKQQASATVSMVNAAPVPTITLGQDSDFRAVGKASIAQVEETQPITIPEVATTPAILNVEPLDGSSQSQSGVVILNPAKDGEEVATSLPEFRGLAPASTTLSVTIESTQAFSDTVVVEDDGTWSWTPPADLETGEHTLTVNYIDKLGIEQTLKRTFTVSQALAAAGEPAFAASPSASILPSSLPTASVIATSSPRTQIPSTESGVPVSGIITPTLLTAGLGFAIMVLGMMMLLVL
ncbi:MAG: Ig-like domain-containing protein [bacterium]